MRQIAPAVYKLRKTIKNLLQPEAHYLLAVSGGADSGFGTCLCCLGSARLGKLQRLSR